MHIVIAVLLALAGAIWWWARRNPGDAIGLADDAVTLARNAPRRMAFRRQTRAHPVEGIDDPRLALAAIGAAWIRLDGLPGREDRARLVDMTRILWRLDEAEAEETLALAEWLVAQCQTPEAAIPRLGRRLWKIDEARSWPELERLLDALTPGAPGPGQAAAMDDLRLALHRRARAAEA